MIDLYIALFIMTLIFVTVFLLSYCAYTKFNKVGRVLFSISVICFILLHIFVLSNSNAWITFLPLKDVIVYSNLLIPLAGSLSGIIWAYRKLHIARRLISIFLLAFLAYQPTLKLIYFNPTQQYYNIWNGDICIQSQQTSCVPAAAATLLRHFDIEANEQEMARLCLTQSDGTSMFGLYRALKIKTKDSRHHTIIGKANLEQLQTEIPLPVILIVSLDEKTNNADPRYSEKWGWGVDIMHSVVLFQYLDNDKVEIGDPSVGLEIWNIQALKNLWHGKYITIK